MAVSHAGPPVHASPSVASSSAPPVPIQTPRRTGGGVADYFTVLGIGDAPTPKYRQKRNPVTGSVSEWGTDEEEECALVERFYREIVEVAVLETTNASEETTAKDNKAEDESARDDE
eukprot:CAMPEP_0113561466 /NCGR_PEP_ID=MMETSP0015_2-20120614/19990_1 /TAXON_ID=2838 /ORGANISM="Odontella" /LENGTH=116 /DNA_ID=CAMNT_0000463261 /DNA_START=223 /DNA_END=570 /DNA_ORIENTATION=+ /assembly_acc=CAM_ASM_000160